MTQLGVIWLLTATLMAMSTLVLMAVALSRVLNGVTEERRQRAKAIVLAELTQSNASARSLGKAIQVASSLGVLAPLVLHVRDVFRGHSYEAFIARLSAAGAFDRLAMQLRSGPTPARRRAAEALSAFPGDRARAALRKAWNDPNRKVRFAALFASTELSNAPPFEHALTLALSARCFPHAARLLRRMAAQRPAEAADWLCRASLAPPLAITLLKGLADASSLSSDITALAASLSSEHLCPDVRAAALVVLGEQDAHHCKSAVLNALDDKIWFVRVQAVTVAGRLRIAEATPALARLSGDPSWWVRFRAGEALARLGAVS